MIHLCRDFETLPNVPSPATSMYLVAAFMQHVAEFAVDSQANFSIDGPAYTQGRWDSPLQAPGTITTVSGTGTVVWLPSGSYAASSADVGRILALRSDANPRHNSGLFRIVTSSFHPTSGAGLVIDYRSPDAPPAESGTLKWRVYESELVVAALWSSASSGGPGYSSRGTAGNSRLMLTSPLGFDVRLALESQADSAGCIPSRFSIAPGVGGTEGADFDNVSGHLHGPMWHDSRDQALTGLAVGLTPAASGSGPALGQWRFTAAADVERSAVACFTRNVSFASGGNGWCLFGLPEDEGPSPSRDMIDRLFVIGYAQALPNIGWHSGFFGDGHALGVGWSGLGYPAPCIMSSYADIRNLVPHTRHLSTAGTSSFSGAIELLDVELLCGTLSSSLSQSARSVAGISPRRLGRVPIARQGAASYAAWSLTPDRAWLHTLDGVYVPWEGPHLLGAPTGSANAFLVMTGSHADGDGLQFEVPNPPMSDPPVDEVEAFSDQDANRFRKTYSYFRQPSVQVTAVRAGSNPAKP